MYYVRKQLNSTINFMNLNLNAKIIEKKFIIKDIVSSLK